MTLIIFIQNVFSLSEFEFIDNMIDFREATYGTHAIRKCDTSRVYIMKAFPATPSLKWPLELRLLEMLTEQACSFLPCILRRIFEHQTLFILLVRVYLLIWSDVIHMERV